MVLLVLPASCIASLEQSCTCGNQCNACVDIKGISERCFLFEPGSCGFRALRFSLSCICRGFVVSEKLKSSHSNLHSDMPGRNNSFGIAGGNDVLFSLLSGFCLATQWLECCVIDCRPEGLTELPFSQHLVNCPRCVVMAL